MKDTQNYLNEVRARVDLSTKAPWGLLSNARTDVPKLMAMFDKAFEFIEGAECWCEKARRAGYKQCTKCDVLSDIEQIARGGYFSDDPEIDRFIKALKTTPLKNTENV